MPDRRVAGPRRVCIECTIGPVTGPRDGPRVESGRTAARSRPVPGPSDARAPPRSLRRWWAGRFRASAARCGRVRALDEWNRRDRRDAAAMGRRGNGAPPSGWAARPRRAHAAGPGAEASASFRRRPCRPRARGGGPGAASPPRRERAVRRGESASSSCTLRPR